MIQFKLFGFDSNTVIQDANDWLKGHKEYQLVNYQVIFSNSAMGIVILYNDEPASLIPWKNVDPDVVTLPYKPATPHIPRVPFPEDSDPWRGEFTPIGGIPQ